MKSIHSRSDTHSPPRHRATCSFGISPARIFHLRFWQLGLHFCKPCIAHLFGPERLLRTPELLEQPHWAAESAAWFWSVKGLNALADRGEFAAITRKINGGLNGLEARLELWARGRAVLCVSST